MKKRLHLSLIALVGSVILFVVTSLAWFTVSEWVNIDFFSGSVAGYNLDYTLYESTDGVTYTETTSIEMTMQVPGDTMYYRIVVNNPSTSNYATIIYFSGITDTVVNGDFSLLEVIQLTSEVDGIVMINDTLENQLSGGMIPVTNSFDLLGSGSETIDFTLSILGSAGNEYQGLGIEIDFIKIYFNVE